MSSISFISPKLDRLDDQAPGGILGVFRFQERSPLSGVAGLVDWRLLGHLSKLVIDGFISGDRDEAVLVPLGARLPQEHLVILGLGRLSDFSQGVFVSSVEKMFQCCKGLGHKDLTLTLPGRPEDRCEITEAIETFLDTFDRASDGIDTTLIEPPGAQKAMLPAVERWRLKHSVPPEPDGM